MKKWILVLPTRSKIMDFKLKFLWKVRIKKWWLGVKTLLIWIFTHEIPLTTAYFKPWSWPRDLKIKGSIQAQIAGILQCRKSTVTMSYDSALCYLKCLFGSGHSQQSLIPTQFCFVSIDLEQLHWTCLFMRVC